MSAVARISPLTTDVVAALPACTSCPHHSVIDDLAWARSTEAVLGWCGVALRQEGEVRGYLLLAAPGLAPTTSVPLSVDAAVVVQVWVHHDVRGHGVGRQLVQAAGAAAHRRRIVALEAVGSHGPGSCVAPSARWLRRTGFEVTRQHPLHPRLRLDLSRTVTWPHLRSAVDRVRGLVTGSQPPPQPTTREQVLARTAATVE